MKKKVIFIKPIIVIIITVMSSRFLLSDHSGTKQLTFKTPLNAYNAWNQATTDDTRNEIFAWLEQFAMRASSSNLSDALKYLKTMSRDNNNRFEKLCHKLIEHHQHPTSKYTIIKQLSAWYMAQTAYDSAYNLLHSHISNDVLAISHKAEAISQAANILSDKLLKPLEAMALLNTHLAHEEDNPLAKAPLLLARAVILDSHLDKKEDSLNDLKQIISYKDQCPAVTYSASVEYLVKTYFAQGNCEEAATTLMLIAQHPSCSVAGIAQKLIKLNVSDKYSEQAVELLRSRANAAFTNITSFSSALLRIQSELVTILLTLERGEEAIAECRALALVIADKDYPKVIELATQSLKIHDGHLGRANTLLVLHQTNSPPVNIRNPLLDFKSLNNPQRSLLLETSKQEPDTWNEWVDRALLYAWLDRPLDSIDAARTAFKLCPMNSNALKRCTDAITRPVLVITRDITLAQRVVDYLLYGSAGSDGKIGTKDDIVDPFPEVKHRLVYNTGEQPALQP